MANSRHYFPAAALVAGLAFAAVVLFGANSAMAAAPAAAVTNSSVVFTDTEVEIQLSQDSIVYTETRPEIAGGMPTTITVVGAEPGYTGSLQVWQTGTVTPTVPLSTVVSTDISGTAVVTTSGFPTGTYAVVWNNSAAKQEFQAGNPGTLHIWQGGKDKGNEPWIDCNVESEARLVGATPNTTVTLVVETIGHPVTTVYTATGVTNEYGDATFVLPGFPAGMLKVKVNNKQKVVHVNCPPTAVLYDKIAVTHSCGGVAEVKVTGNGMNFGLLKGTVSGNVMPAAAQFGPMSFYPDLFGQNESVYSFPLALQGEVSWFVVVDLVDDYGNVTLSESETFTTTTWCLWHPVVVK